MYQMFFATSILHVHLMQWDDDNLVEQAVNKCNEIWESIESNKVSADIPFLAYFILFLMCSCVQFIHLFTSELYYDCFFSFWI